MDPFHGRHFQGESILWAVRWYCKYGISYRELQEMLAERGVYVDHSTIYRGFSAMRRKWKNVCGGTGVIQPTCAPGALMKSNSEIRESGVIFTGNG